MLVRASRHPVALRLGFGNAGRGSVRCADRRLVLAGPRVCDLSSLFLGSDDEGEGGLKLG